MTTTNDTTPVALSVCTDCLYALANGEVRDGRGEDITDAHAKLIEAQWPATLITLGGDHKDCPNAPDWMGEECSCENHGFSWSACEGCGSNLGGDRYAATAWMKD